MKEFKHQAWLAKPGDPTVEYQFCWNDDDTHVHIKTWEGSMWTKGDFLPKRFGRDRWTRLIKEGYLRRLPGPGVVA